MLGQFPNEVVQKLYRAVYFLHRDPEKVQGIIQKATEGFLNIKSQQDSRPEAQQPVRVRAESLEELLQLSLFDVSEQEWQQDLAQGVPQQTPAAQPDVRTAFTQYLMHLCWHGIRHQDSRYTALGLGSLLYTYGPLQVCRVLGLRADNRGRIKLRLQRWLVERFKHIASIRDDAFVTRPPTAWERQWMQRALTLFTPWGSGCIPRDVFHSLDLPLGFDTLPEHDRKHALMHPDCAGIERLVKAWNRHYPEQCLDDPPTKLEVPMFTNGLPPAPDDFDDYGTWSLSDRQLRELGGQMTNWMQRAQKRRRANAFHRLRVCVDGQERLHCTPGAQALPFTVPLSAIRIQVFGQDAEGELPLALFYLPDLEEEGNQQRLYAVLEGGATIELGIAPVHGQDGEVTAGSVAMHFWADEAQVPKTSQWYAEALLATARSVEVARLAGDRRLEAALLARLGNLHQAQHQPDEALTYWRASAELAQVGLQQSYHLPSAQPSVFQMAAKSARRTQDTPTEQRLPQAEECPLEDGRLVGTRYWTSYGEVVFDVRSDAPQLHGGGVYVTATDPETSRDVWHTLVLLEPDARGVLTGQCRLSAELPGLLPETAAITFTPVLAPASAG